MLAARKKTGSTQAAARPLFTSLTGGMQQMVDAIVAQLAPSSIVPSGTVKSLRLAPDGCKVMTSTATEDFDAVILAVPSHVSANLLQGANPRLAGELAGISYTSSITINLGYAAKVRESLPPGFGFLVPRSQQRRILACTFVHAKFPHRAPGNRALVRCFMAGSGNEDLWSGPDEQIVTVVCRELRAILGLSAEPLFGRVYRWDRAMAQYGVGHLERLDRIEQARTLTPAVFLAGNAYRGIGVPDCVRSGSGAANSALSFLGVTSEHASQSA
jgi:protoporphyrinogen/coproporphyrinogen III oxidase